VPAVFIAASGNIVSDVKNVCLRRETNFSARFFRAIFLHRAEHARRADVDVP
jgi:hypothetical protein